MFVRAFISVPVYAHAKLTCVTWIGGKEYSELEKGKCSFCTPLPTPMVSKDKLVKVYDEQQDRQDKARWHTQQ